MEPRVGSRATVSDLEDSVLRPAFYSLVYLQRESLNLDESIFLFQGIPK